MGEAMRHQSCPACAAHSVARGSPTVAGLDLAVARPSHAAPSVHRLTFSCRSNRNAGAWSQKSHLSRSEDVRRVFGFRICQPPLLSPQRSLAVSANLDLGVAQRFQARRSAACAFQGGASWDPADSPLSRVLLSRRRSQSKAGKPGCVRTSAVAGVLALNPFLDQVLLLGTVFAMCIAGVASIPRVPLLFRDEGTLAASPPRKSSSVQQQKKRSLQSQECTEGGAWSQLQCKLSQALLLETARVEEDRIIMSPMLGLQAFARIPRLRLLLLTVRYLRKEVDGVNDSEKDLDLARWKEVSTTVISRSVEPICRDWLAQGLWPSCQSTEAQGVPASVRVAKPVIPEEELPLVDMADHVLWDRRRGDAETSTSADMSVLDNMMDILKDSESISSYLRRSGKEDLYADVIFFMRFGSARLRGCCDYRVFKKHADNLLEDIVVAVAEVVATLFLDCSSVTGLNPHGELWQSFLQPSILSSRSLERFRNEVALFGWFERNFTSVVAIFEDQFDLWTIQMRPNVEREKNQNKSSMKDNGRREGERSSGLVLTRTKVPARRSMQLKGLSGWRYYYSLYLEVSDVVGPLLRMFLSKVGEGLSFLLITLMGRSLGLIYQGIRQSVRWPSSQNGKTSR